MFMRCLHPSQAWLVPPGFEMKGRESQRLVFSPVSSSPMWKPVKVPCGKCIPCLINRKRKWIVRCCHEMEVSKNTWFVTLTYDEDHLPADRKLRPDHFTNFVKSLRYYLGPNRRCRYFGCGEYGSATHRPHYHLILFFPAIMSLDALNSVLQMSWKRGFFTASEATLGRIEYTTGYILKKLHPVLDLFGEELDKPFFRCSQGLGQEMADKYWSEYLANGGIRYKGKVYPIPEYYLNRAQLVYGSEELFEYYAKKMAKLSGNNEMSDYLEMYFAQTFQAKTQRAYERKKTDGRNV